MRSLAASLVALSLVAGLPDAHGLSTPRSKIPQLRINGCADITATELRRLLTIELEAVDADARPLRLGVDCEADQLRIELTLDGRDQARRRVQISQLPRRGRARVVALLVAELASRSGQAPVRAQRRQQAPAPTRARAEPRWRLHGLLLTGGVGDPLALQLGAAVAVSQRLRRWIGWRGELTATRAVAAVVPGEVVMTNLSAALALTLHRGWRRGRGWIGGGLRGGAVRLGGTSTDPAVAQQAFWSGWFGPAGLAEVAFDLGRRASLLLGVEGGYVLRPAQGLLDGEDAFGLAGPWLSVYLGAGIRL